MFGKNNKWFLLTALVVLIIGVCYYYQNNTIQENFETSFKQGNDSKYMYNKSGNNEIVVAENPGRSKYVLKQSGDKTEYTLRFKLPPEEKCYNCNTYRLYYLFLNEAGYDGKEKVYVKFYKNSKYAGKSNLKPAIKVLDTGYKNWFKYYSYFELEKGYDDTVDFVLQCTSNHGYRLVTQIGVTRVVKSVENLPISNKIEMLMISDNPDSHNDSEKKVWKNLIPSFEKGKFTTNEIKFSKALDVVESGSAKYLKITDQLGEGPTLAKTFTRDLDNFSIVATVKGVGETNSDKKSISDVLTIPGNQKYAFKFSIDNHYGRIHVIAGDKKIEVKKDFFTGDMNTYFFVKDGTILKIYVNNNLVHTETGIPNIYASNEDHLIINESKNSDMYLHTFSLYHKELQKHEITELVNYYRNYKYNVDSSSFDIAKIEKADSKKKIDSSKCLDACHRKCTNENDYSECYKGCATSLGECKEACNNDKECLPLCKYSKKNQCPIAFHRDGKYHVYIPKDSKWSKIVGKHGEVAYGKDREIAKEIYVNNFPECKIPDVLDANAWNPYNKYCPFVIKDNPCTSHHCRDVNWSRDPLKCEMSDKCKKNVAHYCETNSKYDPQCYCWKEEYSNDKHCSKFRRHFEGDEKCDISRYNIKEHPDYDKYIRKDKIPCWNCTL